MKTEVVRSLKTAYLTVAVIRHIANPEGSNPKVKGNTLIYQHSTP